MTTPDPTPALLSTARLAEIRKAITGHIGSLEKRRMIEDLLAHLDALTPRAPSVIEARCTETGVVYYVTTAADGTVTVAPRDMCAPSPSFADASKAEKGTMLRAAFDQGRAAERASLTPRAPVDGEALGFSVFIGDMRETDNHATREAWAQMEPEPKAEYVSRALALDAHGYARGRAEGLEGIDRWKMIAEGKDVRIAVLRDEIARLTAERDRDVKVACVEATKHEDARWRGPYLARADELAAAWAENKRLTAELAEARAAEARSVDALNAAIRMHHEGVEERAEAESAARRRGAQEAGARLAVVTEIVDSIRWTRANSDNPGDQTVYVDRLLALFPEQSAAEGRQG